MNLELAHSGPIQLAPEVLCLSLSSECTEKASASLPGFLHGFWARKVQFSFFCGKHFIQ